MHKSSYNHNKIIYILWMFGIVSNVHSKSLYCFTLSCHLLWFFITFSHIEENSWCFAFEKNRDPLILANNPPFSLDGVIGGRVCTMCDTSSRFVTSLYPSVTVSIIFFSLLPFSSRVESFCNIFDSNATRFVVIAVLTSIFIRFDMIFI